MALSNLQDLRFPRDSQLGQTSEKNHSIWQVETARFVSGFSKIYRSQVDDKTTDDDYNDVKEDLVARAW